MGGSHSGLTTEELEEYQVDTYLTKQQILRAYKKFRELVEDDACDKDISFNEDMVKTAELDRKLIIGIKELAANPFKKRICDVFSSGKNKKMNFEDFLSMISTFSENATKDHKMVYAFMIYDFDDDEKISKHDLHKVVDLLTRKSDVEMTKREKDLLVDNILAEGDVDGDGVFTFPEFKHIISKAADFENYFRIQI